MKRTIPLLLTAALVAASGTVAAQDYVFGWNPRTGDVWVDNTLGDMNRYGYRYRESFVDELVRYYGAPRDYVTDLLVQQRWAPGDVYYACAIAQVIGRSCRYVADEWNQDHGEGWGALAQRLGIKPGSAEFHELKRGFVPTYDRWARPIQLDSRLHEAYPDRGNERLVERIRSEIRGNGGGNGRPGNSGRANDNGNGNGNANTNARGNQGQGHARGRGNSGNKGNNGNKGKGNNGNNGKGKGKGKD